MLKKLRLRLTLLAAAFSGAVLVAMALVALTLAEGQLRAGSQATFQSNMSAVVVKLQTDRVISSSWLAQTEAAGGLILSISDAGSPLRFPGAWSPQTQRERLLARAHETALALGLDMGRPPLSVIGTTSVTFEIEGDFGDRYLAAAVLIPAHNSWQSLVLLRDMSSHDGQILLLRSAFAGLVALGVAVLFLLCWVFAGRAIRPIAAGQKRQAEFIAAASHELRAPLAVVRTSTSAMAIAPAEAERLRGVIESECGRMARLVDDLLTLARSDAGGWSIQRTSVDLDTLLLETAEGFYPVAHLKRQTLLLQVPDEPLPPVLGDDQRLRQLLAILLDNALCYTPEGGTVTLSGAGEGRWVLLRVSDTGPGIPPEQAERIFDRFYRADTARSGKEHFGLGLSIARELAALHGGSLQVEDTDSSGATFELRLPRTL